MKHITDRDILAARAALMREIEDGRATPPITEDDVRRETKQRARLRGVIKQRDAAAVCRERKRIERGIVARPGELSLKDWCFQQADKEGLKWWQSIFRRYRAGKYPNLKLRRVNARVIFIQTQHVNGEGK